MDLRDLARTGTRIERPPGQRWQYNNYHPLLLGMVLENRPAGYTALLNTQPDITVVGTAANGAEAVRLCREQQPDVVLMDVRMPTMDGVEATRQLAAEHSGAGPRVLVLTTFDLGLRPRGHARIICPPRTAATSREYP